MKITDNDPSQILIERSYKAKKKREVAKNIKGIVAGFEYVKIKCTYFKPSGKYYADGCEWFAKKLFEGCIYPISYGKRLLELKSLPGLRSGIWDGPFTVKVQGKYTELVIPTPPRSEKE